MDFSFSGITDGLSNVGKSISNGFDTSVKAVGDAMANPGKTLGKFHDFMSNTSGSRAPSQFFSGEPTKNQFDTPESELNIGQKAVNEGARQFSNIPYYTKPSMSALGSAVGDFASDAVSAIPRAFASDFTPAKNLGTDLVNIGKGFATSMIDEGKSMYGSAFNNGLSGLGAPVIGFVRNFASNPASLAVDTLKGVGNGVVGSFSQGTPRTPASVVYSSPAPGQDGQ